MQEEINLDFSGLQNKLFQYNPQTDVIPQIYKLVPETDPILKQKTGKFNFSDPPINPVILYRNLGKTLIEEGGLGLAAPQCGLPYRAFVMRSEEIIGVFNPIIIDKSEEEIILDEGCLSFPALALKIKRPRRIRVRFTEPNGNVVTRVFDGMTARCFLHEYEHLEGITFHTHVTKAKLQLAETKRKKILKGSKNG